MSIRYSIGWELNGAKRLMSIEPLTSAVEFATTWSFSNTLTATSPALGARKLSTFGNPKSTEIVIGVFDFRYNLSSGIGIPRSLYISHEMISTSFSTAKIEPGPNS